MCVGGGGALRAAEALGGRRDTSPPRSQSMSTTIRTARLRLMYDSESNSSWGKAETNEVRGGGC